MELKDVTNGGAFKDEFGEVETIVVDGRPTHFSIGFVDEWTSAKWESMTREDRVRMLIRWERSKIGNNGQA